jgi:hypothetical protein
VVCWDYRQQGQVLSSYPRTARTHQHIGFDVDITSQYLITGSDDQEALVYSLQSGEVVSRFSGHSESSPSNFPSSSSSLSSSSSSSSSSRQVVNGAGFHPLGLPFVALSTGTRHIKQPYGSPADDDDDDNNENDHDDDDDVDERPSKQLSSIDGSTGQLMVYEMAVFDVPANVDEHSATKEQDNTFKDNDTIMPSTLIADNQEVVGSTNNDNVCEANEVEADQKANDSKRMKVENTLIQQEKSEEKVKGKFMYKGKEMFIYERADGSVCLRSSCEGEQLEDVGNELHFSKLQWEVLQAALAV